jgi:hypothetical protein
MEPWALVDLGGRILTWADMTAKEARDANLELVIDGEPFTWYRLELIN